MLWWVNGITNIYLYNDLDLMKEYYKKLSQIGDIILDKIFSRHSKIQL